MSRSRSRARRLIRRGLFALLALLGALAIAALLGRAYLRRSLPDNSGERTLAHLAAPVSIGFDAAGIPTIDAASPDDAAFALGFIHARDRYFQMDIYRRLAAGELAELVGPGGLPIDRARRINRFRHTAAALYDTIPDHHRRQIDAYTHGVNAGLADLGARPPEYILLGAPAPWLPDDCILVQFTMFDGLNFSAESELEIDALLRVLPPEIVEFLTPDVMRRDALLGGVPSDYAPAPIPSDLALDPDVLPFDPDVVGEMFNEALGSNQWAIAGSRTADGRAILANDPHLELGAPSVWYRARIKWTSPEGRAVDVTGVSLPGFPGIVIGGTPDLAWGFTNSGADQEDFILVEPDPADPSRYLTDNGPTPFLTVAESLRDADGGAETLEVSLTQWGPIAHTAQGRKYAKRWVAHDPDKVNFNLLDLPGATTLEDAAEIARSWHGPSQNILLADAHGRIAWTLSGYIPRRRGFDGKHPVAWRSGIGWDGEGEKPVTILDPPGGTLFTANNRTFPAAASRPISRFWMLPDRAQRIGELLAARPIHDEASLYAMQLDTRAAAMDFYRDLVLTSIPPGDAALSRARANVDSWNGHADADQRGYPILVAFRRQLRIKLLAPIVSRALAADPEFRYTWPLGEEAVLRIFDERPAHLLPPPHKTWEDLARAALTAALADLEAIGHDADSTWGDLNIAMLQHPLSRAIPALSVFLDMPRDALSGDMNVVRVAKHRFGASMRMVVSPGHLGDAILQTPAGQSGHPFSPQYRTGHGPWLRGEPTPWLPGPASSSFKLMPR